MTADRRILNKYQQIAACVPSGSEVLDVGCGAGQLADALAEKNCIVDGVDISLERVQNRERYRSLREQDIQSSALAEGSCCYDVLIFADVLEHLTSPDAVLKHARKYLKEQGRIVISLPNVAYFLNRLGLLRGEWHYQDEGILDRTHLRFFTLATAREFIESNGYSILRMEPEQPVITSAWKRGLFRWVCRRSPSLFAIGWVMEIVPR